MVLSNAYEVVFDNVTLRDETGGRPLGLDQGYLGALIFGDFPHDQIEVGEGVSERVITDGPREQLR